MPNVSHLWTLWCPKKGVTKIVNTTLNTSDQNDGFQQVKSRKRNNKGKTASQIPRGVPVSKGFQMDKQFSYVPKASKAGTTSGNITSHTVSKSGPSIESKSANDNVSKDRGKNKDVTDSGNNIKTSNAFDVLKQVFEVDDDDELVESIYDESANLLNSQTGASTPDGTSFNV
nr:hypothetical protein [Tanacetum cinerariifolium]